MQHTHKPISLVEIKATNKDGTRLYETPEGNEYPSITTVLSIRNKQGLNAWRKRVGNDVANYISRTAAARGTGAHKCGWLAMLLSQIRSSIRIHICGWRVSHRYRRHNHPLVAYNANVSGVCVPLIV